MYTFNGLISIDPTDSVIDSRSTRLPKRYLGPRDPEEGGGSRACGSVLLSYAVAPVSAAVFDCKRPEIFRCFDTKVDHVTIVDHTLDTG